MKLFDKTLTLLESALDVRLTRQNVLAGNLANVDTPGFSPKDLDFKRALAAATQSNQLAQAHDSLPASEGHIPLQSSMGLTPPQQLGGASVSALTTQPGLDGNGVDLDRTLVAMAQNALQYGAAARAAGKKLAILRFVASDGAT